MYEVIKTFSCVFEYYVTIIFLKSKRQYQFIVTAQSKVSPLKAPTNLMSQYKKYQKNVRIKNC